MTKEIKDKKKMTMSDDRATIIVDSNTIEELDTETVWNDMVHLEQQIRQTEAQVKKMESENSYEVARKQNTEQYERAMKEIDVAEKEQKSEKELDNIKFRLQMMKNFSNSAKGCLILELSQYKENLALKVAELKIAEKYDRLDGKEKDKVRAKIIATALQDTNKDTKFTIDDVNNPLVAEIWQKEF